jgi:hypothetical protein
MSLKVTEIKKGNRVRWMNKVDKVEKIFRSVDRYIIKLKKNGFFDQSDFYGIWKKEKPI